MLGHLARREMEAAGSEPTTSDGNLGTARVTASTGLPGYCG
ncbi:hypothetical protein [Kitasatospora sp. NPDC091276]